MESLILFTNTLILRPCVFVFLAVSLFIGQKLLGWRRTGRLFGLTWAIGFICEYASTRIPSGEYFYTEATQGHELCITTTPLMDSLSYAFLLFASYCLALIFVLPPVKRARQHGWLFDPARRTSWSVMGFSAVLFTFLGQIYGYPVEVIYFGVPLANFAEWAVVGFLSLLGYRWLERGPYASESNTPGGSEMGVAAGNWTLLWHPNL
jgi:uncharacterized membrane protein